MKAPTNRKQIKKTDTLEIEIELNPLLTKSLPKIISAINDDPASDLFAKIKIQKHLLKLNCYDLYELINSDLLSELEKKQLKTQAIKAIDTLKSNSNLTTHQLKNFSAAIAAVK